MTGKILAPDWLCDKTRADVPGRDGETAVLAFDDGADCHAAIEADAIFDTPGGTGQAADSSCCND